MVLDGTLEVDRVRQISVVAPHPLIHCSLIVIGFELELILLITADNNNVTNIEMTKLTMLLTFLIPRASRVRLSFAQKYDR